MFNIEMLPANEGDGLWIDYGEIDGAVHHVLIDCGRKTAYRSVAKRLGDDPAIVLDLFVLTHVDADHIAGAVPLLQDEHFGKDRVLDVWFNGWRHLNGLHLDPEGPKLLGARQGEYFAAVLRDREYPWNGAFNGFAVVADDELPVRTLAGGMTLTLLGPTPAKLDEMRRRWKKDLDDVDGLEPGDWRQALDLLDDDAAAGPDLLSGGRDPEDPIDVHALTSTPFDPDNSEPNGSSIAFLAEFGAKKVLFTGDAHAPELADSLRTLISDRGLERLQIDALKMSHHGSARNNSSELLDLLKCDRYLVSTNGTRHDHPDREALARVLTSHGPGVEFIFNYDTEETRPWGDPDLMSEFGYSARYPDGDAGIKVEL